MVLDGNGARLTSVFGDFVQTQDRDHNHDEDDQNYPYVEIKTSERSRSVFLFTVGDIESFACCIQTDGIGCRACHNERVERHAVVDSQES